MSWWICARQWRRTQTRLPATLTDEHSAMPLPFGDVRLGGKINMVRCLGPFLVETCALVEEGVGLEQLDKVMKSYGLPVGPITLADEVRTFATIL